MQETRVNNKWSVKILIFLLASSGLGVWGLFDALIVYPTRGRAAAVWALREYLEAAQDSGDLLVSAVAYPKARLRDLDQEKTELHRQASQSGGLESRRATTKLKRLEWLSALRNIGMLDAEHTRIDNPEALLSDLQANQANLSQPKPLSALDIPMQWVFVFGGLGGAAWLLYLWFSVAKKKHRYDRQTLTLLLANGVSITPDSIAEVDKRKWDKFIVTLRLKDGSNHRLDLLRYTPLEEWVLEMEKHTEGYEGEDAPEEPETPEAPASDDEESHNEPASESPSSEPTPSSTDG